MNNFPAPNKSCANFNNKQKLYNVSSLKGKEVDNLVINQDINIESEQYNLEKNVKGLDFA